MLRGLLSQGLILIALAGLTLGGCQSMTRNKEQQARKHDRVTDINMRLLAEDFDAIMLLDKPSALSKWHVPFE